MPLNLEDLKKLLVNPEEALLNAAKKKNINEALVILVLNSILISVALGISLKNYSLIPGVLVAGIIGVLFSAFLLQVAFSIIGGKGKYVDALISLTYPFFGFSLSFLIVSLISLYSSYASIIAGVILFLVYWIVSLVGMVRVLKESYKLDIITVWITVSLVMLAAALTIYTIAILALPGSFLTSSPLYPYR
ncbi:MAG: hypothetical protein ACP5JK_01835 [Candidatus Aenigmatarchaeota archaeon]